MASIYNESTNVGSTGRFAPSVSYNVAVKQPNLQTPELKDLTEEHGLNIDITPIANAMLKSQELDTKLEMSKLKHDLNLRKLEAQKKTEKNQEKDYSVLKSVSQAISDLDLAAPGMPATQYQAHRKRIIDNAVAVYQGNPKDIYSIADAAGWGYKEEIIANRKDESKWVQDQRQARVDALTADNKFLQSVDPANRQGFIDKMERTLYTVQQADTVVKSPDTSDGDKEYAKQVKETNAISLASQLLLAGDDTGNLPDFSNPATYSLYKDEKAKRLSAATGLNYSESKLAVDLAANRAGLADLANDSDKIFQANKKYVEDHNAFVAANVKADLNNIPIIRASQQLSPQAQEALFNADPSIKNVIGGALLEYVASYNVDETNGDATLKVLGNAERLNNYSGKEAPSIAMGRQHAATHLTPFEISKQFVISGNRGTNPSPYSDYYWYMGNNGVQAALATQAMNVQSVEDVNTVVTNINNGDQLVNGPVASGKRDVINAANPNNTIVQNNKKVFNDLQNVKEGLLLIRKKFNDEGVMEFITTKNYMKTSNSFFRFRHDVENGKVVILEDAKGFMETLGSLNEFNVMMNIENFNKMISHLPVEQRNKIIKWAVSDTNKGIIKELQEGDVVQEVPGVISTTLDGIGTLAGIGVDAIAQGIETVRQNVEPAKVIVQGAKKVAELSEKADPYVLTPADIVETTAKGKWISASTDTPAVEKGPIENAVEVEDGVLMGWEEYTDMFVIRNDNTNMYYKFKSNGDERPFEEIYKDFKEGKIKAEEVFKYVQ